MKIKIALIMLLVTTLISTVGFFESPKSCRVELGKLKVRKILNLPLTGSLSLVPKLLRGA